MNAYAVGRARLPAVSLYLTVTPELEIVSHESRLETVPVAANLRHHEIEPLFNDETLATGLPDSRFRDELSYSGNSPAPARAGAANHRPCRASTTTTTRIDGDTAELASCRVTITEERKRGSPLDKLVARTDDRRQQYLGRAARRKGIAAIYRAQTAGKVRMTTSPLPHEGLGVAQYAWSSSPLRRYVDLVNQWQLIAHLQDLTPHFGGKGKTSNDVLFAAMRDFDLTYAAYAEFQRGMERYWCLRWLQQEQVTTIDATVRRESLVKLDHLPLLLRVPLAARTDAGTTCPPGRRGMDELTLDIGCRYLETLAAADAADAAEETEAID